MTLKKYLKENLSNCLLNDERIDFETIYQKYNNLKAICGSLAKEYDTKITVSNKGIILNIHNFKKMNLSYFVSNNKEDDAYLFTIINGITYTLKKIASRIKYSKNHIDLDFTFIETINNITHLDFILLIPKLIKNLEEKYNFNTISERFIPENDNSVGLVNYLNFKDNNSEYFHMFLVEIAYYTFEIEHGSGQPKICPICHEAHYQHSKYCKKCNDKRNNERRKANAKCKRLRKRIKNNLIKNKNMIPTNIYRDANDVIYNPNHKYTDLKKLIQIDSTIKNILKK